MALKFAKGIRNHWKKSTFFALAVAYGANYAKDSYESQQLMRQYCLEARKLGDESIPVDANPRSVTVILNPTANRRKAVKQFEKYCAPILHLAGICVDVLQTESEGHARTLVENLKKTDAIIVAGGDGTVSEVVTGLFRRSQDDKYENPCPIGVLPLGRTNTLGNILFPGAGNLAMVKSLGDASMAIVTESTKPVDVMKIEILQSDNRDTTDPNDDPNPEPPKPIYALATVEWGAYRDATAKQDKYWYYGSLRKYATYIFNGYKKNLSWECAADVNYLLPCGGCSNCHVDPKETNQRWWSRFVSKPKTTRVDYSKITNDKCRETHHDEINTSDFTLRTSNRPDDAESVSRLNINLGPRSVNYVDFVRDGFRTLDGKERRLERALSVRQIEIIPKVDAGRDVWYSIDKEEYEVRPVRVTLLPRVLRVYRKKD